MSLSDCTKCWDTPCTCGWHWRNRSKESRITQAAVVLGISKEYLADRMGDIIPEEHPLKEKD